MIDTKGLNKADVLCVLYNHAKPQGRGFLQYKEGNLSIEDAENLLMHTLKFEYLHGRVLKVDLSSDDSFDEYLYDRDNGKGAAENAIASLRKEA